MTEPLRQTVTGWDDWPDDVRAKLREWNRLFLLSFVRTGDFLCAGCGRLVAGHPDGNAVVRHEKHTRGVERCEGCLVSLARAHDVPPADLAGEDEVRRSYRGALRSKERQLAGVRENTARLRAGRERLRRQLEVDQVYIGALEAMLEPEELAEVKERMRGLRLRRSEQEGDAT